MYVPTQNNTRTGPDHNAEHDDERRRAERARTQDAAYRKVHGGTQAHRGRVDALLGGLDALKEPDAPAAPLRAPAPAPAATPDSSRPDARLDAAPVSAESRETRENAEGGKTAEKRKKTSPERKETRRFSSAVLEGTPGDDTDTEGDHGWDPTTKTAVVGGAALGMGVLGLTAAYATTPTMPTWLNGTWAGSVIQNYVGPAWAATGTALTQAGSWLTTNIIANTPYVGPGLAAAVPWLGTALVAGAGGVGALWLLGKLRVGFQRARGRNVPRTGFAGHVWEGLTLPTDMIGGAMGMVGKLFGKVVGGGERVLSGATGVLGRAGSFLGSIPGRVGTFVFGDGHGQPNILTRTGQLLASDGAKAMYLGGAAGAMIAALTGGTVLTSGLVFGPAIGLGLYGLSRLLASKNGGGGHDAGGHH